jgi:hypothetical protein
MFQRNFNSLVAGWLLAILPVLATGCARHQSPDYSTSAADITRLASAAGGASAAAVVEEVANPTGWATVKGKFSLSGPVTLPPIVVTKDPNVCGNTSPNMSVVLGPGNSLQFVLIYLDTKLPTLDDPWVHPSYAETATATVDFDQKQCIFLSHVFGMRSTQKLKVLNSDTVGHNTAIKAFGFDTIIPAGSSSMVDSVKAIKEPAPTACAIHPWMSAFIMATPHPYIAVTDENGEFEIKNVPAGVDLQFKIWQEKVRYVKSATVGGAPTTWPKGTMKVKLENDQVLEVDAVLDAASFQ